MRRVVLLPLILLAGCATTPRPTPIPAPLKDWTLTATWSFDFTNFPQCATTITTGGNKGCISGFSWGYMQGGVPVQLKVAPLTACTGATQPMTCTDTTNATVGIGTVTAYVIANGYDNNGIVVASVPDLAATPNTVAIGTPTNAALTLK